jgi:hypothetical protein
MADTKISALPSGAPAQAGDEYVVARSGANFKLTLTNIAASMPAITTNGTVTVSGTGLKFNADFSNATAANRFAFQSSTTDAVTRVPAIPNGTGTTATWQAFNSSAMNNCANIQFGVDSTSAFFSTAVVGSGTAVPFNFNLGGSTRMSITTAGLVGIANPSPIVNLEVGSNSETPKAIGVRHGTVPAYVANSFDGTNALGTFSCNIYETSSGSQSWSAFGSALYGAAAVQVVGSTTGSEVRVLTASAANTNPTEKMKIDKDGVITDQYGKIRAIPQSGSNKTTSYTLATTDVGRFIGVGSGGSITIPDATFATGDVVSIFNNTSGNITITCTITTAYLGGTDADKATVTLATRGVATILFLSGTVCVINGNVS